MLYLIENRPQMIFARFEFKPEEAHRFIDSDTGQTVVESTFDSVEELIETARAFEDCLIDCIALVNGKMLCLSSFKTK